MAFNLLGYEGLSALLRELPHSKLRSLDLSVPSPLLVWPPVSCTNLQAQAAAAPTPTTSLQRQASGCCVFYARLMATRALDQRAHITHEA